MERAVFEPEGHTTLHGVLARRLHQLAVGEDLPMVVLEREKRARGGLGEAHRGWLRPRQGWTQREEKDRRRGMSIPSRSSWSRRRQTASETARTSRSLGAIASARAARVRSQDRPEQRVIGVTAAMVAHSRADLLGHPARRPRRSSMSRSARCGYGASAAFRLSTYA